MKRKFIVGLTLIAIASSLLAGCGNSDGSTTQTESGSETEVATSEASTDAGTTSDTEPIELTFIYADGDAGAKTSINKIVDDFNNSQTDVVVRVEPGNGGAYGEFLKTKDSVGEFPDILEMRDTAIYVRAGKLAPLSEDIVNMFSSTTAFDGSVYTAPMAAENTQGIIYNKTYFDENGLSEPTTYDEFIALCEQIKELGDMSPLVVGGQDIWHMGFWFNKAYNDQVLSTDPDFISHCYDGSKNFSDETFKATFTEMQEIMQFAQDGWVSTPDAQITTFLVGDMSAMLFSGTHMFSQIISADPDFEMGWFPVQSPDGKTRLVGGAGAGGLSISAEASADPVKKAGAEAFIKFFFAPENYKLYCETLNFIPTTVDAPDLDVPDVLNEVIDATKSADELSPMWNSLQGENELPPDFRNFTYKTLIEVLQGTRDIDSACDELNKTWQVNIQSFNPVTGIGIN